MWTYSRFAYAFPVLTVTDAWTMSLDTSSILQPASQLSGMTDTVSPFSGVSINYSGELDDHQRTSNVPVCIESYLR